MSEEYEYIGDNGELKIAVQAELLPDVAAELLESYRNRQEELKRANARAGRVNLRARRQQSKDRWTQVLSGASMPEYVLSMLKQFVMLPRADFQIPLVASYLMLPSAMCDSVPIEWSVGPSGSGKSVLGLLACAIHSIDSIGASSTPASLRNSIKTARCWDPELPMDYEGNEKCGALVWEDINADSLKRYEGKILELLKNGIKSTGVIQMAGEPGKNLTFNVFSPKYISTIHALYSLPEFVELKRRLLIVEHKPIAQWTPTDYSTFYEGMNPSELRSTTDIDWSGLDEEFTEYWSDEDTLASFDNWMEKLKKAKPRHFTQAYWELSRDLIATGLTCGYWTEIKQAVAHVWDYWTWHSQNVENTRGATQKALEQFLGQQIQALEKNNKVALEANRPDLCAPIRVAPQSVLGFLKAQAAQGALDTGITTKEIQAVMNSIGWRLDIQEGNLAYWVRM